MQALRYQEIQNATPGQKTDDMKQLGGPSHEWPCSLYYSRNNNESIKMIRTMRWIYPPNPPDHEKALAFRRQLGW